MKQLGDKIPNTDLIKMGTDGPETVNLAEIGTDKTLVVFALPGAYTPTCTNDHLPSFINNADAIRAKGVDGIYCVTVNDPFVTKAWGEASGANDVGIEVLADSASTFTEAMGLAFSAEPVGLINRSQRYAMIVKDGEITWLDVEENPGQCSLSNGTAVLDALG